MGDRKMYLVGQKSNKELIDNGGLNNASFIMIKGPTNYGKTYLTKYIANYYEMDYILLDNKVDTIRSLVESSNKNNNCLYHLKDFHKSSPAAKAALLKIAEETPKGVKIVVTTNAYNFLETLTSRAYLISMQPYNSDEIEEYNEKLMLNEETMRILKEDFSITLTPTLLYKYKERKDIDEIIDLVKETIECVNMGLRLECVSKIANNFWKEDLEKVEMFIQTLIKANKLFNQDVFYFTSILEDTLNKLNRITITNYKQLIHNMLMEMI